MSDVSANPSFYEQLKAVENARSQQRFIDALDAKSGVKVTSEDILAAASFSRDQLYMIVLLTLAKARIAKEADL